MFYREMIAVCSEILTEHLSSIRCVGITSKFWMFNLVVLGSNGINSTFAFLMAAVCSLVQSFFYVLLQVTGRFCD